jgi:hypothetical protein
MKSVMPAIAFDAPPFESDRRPAGIEHAEVRAGTGTIPKTLPGILPPPGPFGGGHCARATRRTGDRKLADRILSKNFTEGIGWKTIWKET